MRILVIAANYRHYLTYIDADLKVRGEGDLMDYRFISSATDLMGIHPEHVDVLIEYGPYYLSKTALEAGRYARELGFVPKRVWEPPTPKVH